ncbi:hypothetical protein SAMD00020551_4397 [Mesobacillus selenatarsenatis SF-1]|uniref:Uncharacterized protein n=1 Tax=Mesobacillus selenatarsenatis (strain DSM 18680 / JCM 14380 / FERM P-15431 / SF-1) TaxID=1321606 RepID=A0A0A8XA94_MESS1|nr:hypothetical protein SAMD00020551_4397 [Mesobacillus selenatarsenatis SF-1]
MKIPLQLLVLLRLIREFNKGGESFKVGMILNTKIKGPIASIAIWST